jgi:hypothetical protein
MVPVSFSEHRRIDETKFQHRMSAIVSTSIGQDTTVRQGLSMHKLFTEPSLEFKIDVKKMRIIEMRPADKFDGMVTALSHAANIGYAHREKNIRFNSLRKFSDTP